MVSLPNLKAFSIHYCNKITTECKLTIDTPKLKYLKIEADYYYLFIIELIYPQSLEFIQANDKRLFDSYKFPNLKTIVFRNLNHINDDFLSNLNQLDEIHFTSSKVLMNIFHQKNRNSI